MKMLQPGLLLFLSTCASSAIAAGASTADEAGEPAVDLADFVVTGTRTLQAAEVAPVRVRVVGAAEVERLGARSFADAMEYAPGVQVESNCQNCNTTEIRLLGLSGAYNQIAFDGLPMLSSLAGVYGVEQVPAAFVERIEIVKGGGSSLYGASAVAGVINIVPRTVRESGATAEYRLDSVKGRPAHLASVIVDHVSDHRGLAMTGYAQVARVSPVDLNDDGFTEITRRRMSIGGLRARASALGLEWTADLNHTDEFRRGGNRLDGPAHLANIAEELKTRRLAGTFSVASAPGGDFGFKAVVAAALTRRESYYGGLGEVVVDPADPEFDPDAFAEALAVSRRQYGRTRNPLYVADLQFDHRLARRTLTWGVQAEYETIDDRNLADTGAPTGAPPLEGDFSNVALFVQDDWRVAERLTLVTGVRLDRSNQLGRVIASPRLAFRHATSDTLTFRGAVGTGFRAPRVFDEDLHIDTLGAEPIRIVNAEGLKREGAVTVNLGATWNPRPFAEVLAFEANVFGARLRDAFQLSEIRTDDEGDLFQERFNSGGVRVVGTEFNVAYSFSPRLRADLGVVAQRARLDDAETILDDGAGTVVATRRFNKTPSRFAVLTLQYENDAAFDWALGVRHLGAMHVLNNNTGAFDRAGSFLVVDASVGRHFRAGGREWLVRLGVVNLTDDRQRDLESGAGRDSDYVYGPRSPRTFFTSVRCTF